MTISIVAGRWRRRSATADLALEPADQVGGRVASRDLRVDNVNSVPAAADFAMLVQWHRVRVDAASPYPVGAVRAAKPDATPATAAPVITMVAAPCTLG